MNLPIDINSQINSAISQGMNQFNQALANSGVNLPAGTTNALQNAVQTAANTAGAIAQNIANNIDVNNIDVNAAINASNALKDYANNAVNALNNPNGLQNIGDITSSFNNYMNLANQFFNSLGIDLNTWLPQITEQMTKVVVPVWQSALGALYQNLSTNIKFDSLNNFDNTLNNIFINLKDNTALKSQFTPIALNQTTALNTASIKNDLITGDKTANKIFAGNGNDLVDSGAGADIIDGGNGADKITSGIGNDKIDAGDGNDIIKAGAGNDTVLGGNGDDLISGDEGNDVIKAGDGMDIIDGGAGSDKLYGGNGKDIFVFAQGNNLDTIYDFKAKTDMLSFNFDIDFTNSAKVNSDLKISQSNKDIKITYAPTNDVLMLKNVTSANSNINSFEKLVDFIGQNNLILPTVVDESNSAKSFELKAELEINTITCVGINDFNV